MRKLDEIKKDGFMLGSTGSASTDIDLAIISLRIGLEAYFSTYDAQRYFIHMFDGTRSTDEVDLHHMGKYSEKCTETIVHIQHFFELVCKKILRDEHPLLVDTNSTDAVILHKLLTDEALSQDEEAGVGSIELSTALKRLFKLLKNGRIKNTPLANCLELHYETIRAVNDLRNRVWHRGLHMLRYPALDELMGGYVLPCIDDMMKMPLLAGQHRMWKYKTLECGIDPIEEIIRSYKHDSTNVEKTSFLKELGRAAYSDAPHADAANAGKPVDFTTLFDRKKLAQAERLAAAESRANGSQVDGCPVCGLRTLLVLDDTVGDYDDSPSGETWWFTYRVHCVNCTLDMVQEVGNASDHGLLGIKDFWTEYKVQ